MPTIVVLAATIGTYSVSYIIGLSVSNKKNKVVANTPIESNNKTTKKKTVFFKTPFGLFVIVISIIVTLFFISRYQHKFTIINAMNCETTFYIFHSFTSFLYILF